MEIVSGRYVYKMIDKLLREFAEENFGDQEGKYFPVCHGQIQEIRPFGLMVKKPRSFLERPLKKYKYTTLAGLERYVVKGKDKEFLESLNKSIVKEDRRIVLEEENKEDDKGAASKLEFGVKAANCANVTVKINQDLGFLELGRIDQEYILDPDIREILANVELDSAKAEGFQDLELRLITSVIYSERFALKGNRKNEVEVDGGVNIPTQMFAQLKGKFKKCHIPPKLAKRNERGPFLFRCCKVVYDKESNKLNLAKGEYVGKDTFRDLEHENEEDEEYNDTAVSLEEDQESNLADFFTDEDSNKLEIIKNSVLKPTKNREVRKARVNKYLHWFEEALLKKQKRLLLDEPLTAADCQFLRSIFVPAFDNRVTVNLPKAFDEEKIQGYAIVLKIISDFSEENWDEIEQAWAAE